MKKIKILSAALAAIMLLVLLAACSGEKPTASTTQSPPAGPSNPSLYEGSNDPQMLLTCAAMELGCVSAFEYDDDGRLTAVINKIIYTVVSTDDTKNYDIYYTYGEDGRFSGLKYYGIDVPLTAGEKENTLVGSAEIFGQKAEFTFTLSEDGRIVKENVKAGSTNIENVFNASGRLKSEKVDGYCTVNYVYTANGVVENFEYVDYTGVYKAKYEITYNDDGSLAGAVYSDQEDSTYTVSWTYDEGGKCTLAEFDEKEDSGDARFEMAYDADGNLISVDQKTKGEGGEFATTYSEKYTYENGIVKKVFAAEYKADGTCNVSAEYVYDANKDVIQYTTIRYTDGVISEKRFGENEYDILHRLVKEIVTVSDKDGVIKSKSGKGYLYKDDATDPYATAVLKFDSEGEYTGKTVTEKQYNDSGAIIKIIETDLDSADVRVEERIGAYEGGINTSVATTYFDENGEVRSTANTTYTYNENKKLTLSVTVYSDKSGNELEKEEKSYDANKNCTVETVYAKKESGFVITKKTEYKFNDKNKVTEKTVYAYDNGEITGYDVTSYEYDDKGEISHESTVKYDKDGNKI